MIVYRNATLSDMNEVAKVHMITQPEYFTTTLGQDLLAKFYTEFLNEDDLFVVAVDDSNQNIVGFCMGNHYGSKAEKNWEIKYKHQIMKRLLFKCIQFNRLALSRSFRRLKGLIMKPKNIKKDVYCWHLLSLGVLPNYRGSGIGRKLIDEFEKKCLSNSPSNNIGGKYSCTIGAYKWNKNGCRLYERSGYKVFEESKDKLKFIKILK